MVLNNKSVIYICCPPKFATGGPEALHQLYYYLKKKGYNAVMVYYYNIAGEKCLIHDRYKKYCTEYIIGDEVIDIEDNIIVIPETYIRFGFQYKNIRKCIWWLSVGYFDINKPTFRQFLGAIKRMVFKFSIAPIKEYCNKIKNFNNENKAVKSAEVNFVGSKYAFEYLTRRKLRNVEYLVEPISKEFLDAGKYSDISNRSDTVLYNPSKDSKIMQKLLESNKFNFQPLKGFTPNQLIELYKSSKLYIDFGDFGGPERIPKETVYNGCVILVADHNAASNDFDIAIKKEYKIKKFNDLSVVTARIEYMLSAYEDIVQDFREFQNKIDMLEFNFNKQIDKCFIIAENSNRDCHENIE